MATFYQFNQPALAQHSVSEIEPGELDLLRMVNLKLI
jgi:hypothetical protein